MQTTPNIYIIPIRIQDPLYVQVYNLREEILRKPLGLSLKNEDLSNDAKDMIFIALHNGQVIACLMLHTINLQVIKLRQMAVAEAWQGKGIGKRLVQHAEHYCKLAGYMQIELHARKHALPFYQNSGYTIQGGMFTEVNIPHFKMMKQL
jgi:predicted GNAT family N-acyltransferase